MLARNNKKNKSVSVCGNILNLMPLSDKKATVQALLNKHIRGMNKEEIFLILQAAVQSCHKDVLKSLMMLGVNLDVGIKIATHLGSESTVKFLLNITVDNPISQEYIASIELAIERGDEKILALFLSPVRRNVEVACDPLLSKVAKYGHIHLLDFFWPRVERKSIVTALDRAIQYSQLAFVEALQERGVSLDELRQGVFSALFSAARSNDLNMLNYVNDNIQECDLGHALFVAAENNFLISVDFILSRPGVNVDYVEINNKTPLLVAIEESSFELVRKFIDKGADPCGVPGTIPPVVAAIRKNFPAALELLVKNNASLILPSYNLWHEAVKEKADRAIGFLGMHYRKNINDHIDVRGNTVLHAATTLGYKESIIELIQLGADAYLPNIAGETPLQLAAQGNDINTYLIMFSGWGSLPSKEKQLISKGKVNDCLDNYNLDFIRSLISLGFPDIFKSYRPLIFNKSSQGGKILNPILPKFGFECVLAASELVTENVDARAMILPMMDYFELARVAVKLCMSGISEGDAISFLDSLYLSHAFKQLLLNYNPEKQKQQIVVLNIANMHAVGRHVVKVLAYMWLDNCQHMLALFEKAVSGKCLSFVDSPELCGKLQSIIGLCEFYVMMNNLYIASEKMLNDDRYSAKLKVVMSKALHLSDSVTKKIRQIEQIKNQEQSKQQAIRTLEEKVKAQKEAQILEGERLQGLQEKYAREAVLEEEKKALDSIAVMPTVAVNLELSVIQACPPSEPIKSDVLIEEASTSSPTTLQPALHQKTFKLTIEMKQAFAHLDKLAGELYAVGGSVIAMITGKTVPNMDVDIVGFNVDIFQLASLGFYQSREMPSLYRNKKLNIDLYAIQDSSPDRLHQAMRARDFTACSLMCDVKGVVFALNASYFDDALDGVLRAVGSPVECFEQDCIRVLRAIKYSLKGFKLDEELLLALRSWDKLDFTPHERVHVALIVQGLLQYSQQGLVEALMEYGLLKKLFNIELNDSVEALRMVKYKVSALIAREYKCSKVSESGIFALTSPPTFGRKILVDVLFSQP